jgi:hypothetical protein
LIRAFAAGDDLQILAANGFAGEWKTGRFDYKISIK